jgi:hypothetical protein
MNLRWSFWRAERMAVGGASHGVALIVVRRAGAGPGLRGRPRDHVALGRFSKIARALSVQSSLSTCHLQKHPFDSPCNLRTSQSLHRAIFVRPAAGHGAIVRDGSSPALILMVLPVWLGRSLDTNGPGTPTLDTKVRSSKSRGIGLPFVPQQKVVI